MKSFCTGTALVASNGTSADDGLMLELTNYIPCLSLPILASARWEIVGLGSFLSKDHLNHSMNHIPEQRTSSAPQVWIVTCAAQREKKQMPATGTNELLSEQLDVV